MARLLRFLFTTALAALAVVALTSTKALAQADATPSTWAVRLDLVGDKRLEVVARVRAITGLGVKEANDLVLSAPVVVKGSLSRSDAESHASQLHQVGASASVIAEAPPSAPAPAPSGPPQPTLAAPGEAAFAVRLEAEGPTRVEVVKRVRAVTKLGLKESDDLVKAAPTVVVDKLTRSSADDVAAYLREAGATVQVTSAAAPAPSAPPAPSTTAPRPGSSFLTPPLPSSRPAPQQLDSVIPLVYDLVLREAGPNRLAVVNFVRKHRGISLKEANDFVARLPRPLLEGVSRANAEAQKRELDALLAVTEIVRAAPPAAPAPSASAPPQPPPATLPPSGAASDSKRRPQAHKKTYRIVLQGHSDKTAIMAAVRQVTGLGLKEANALVASMPAVVRTGLSKADADAHAQKLREAGGTIAIEAER